jgi:hypothetical protein
MIISILAYYIFTIISKNEHIFSARTPYLLGILFATLLSSLVTVYDKYLIFDPGMQSLDIQAWSALQRTLISLGFLLLIPTINYKPIAPVQWSCSVPFMGIAWVIAEMIYFMAYSAALPLWLLADRTSSPSTVSGLTGS